VGLTKRGVSLVVVVGVAAALAPPSGLARVAEGGAHKLDRRAPRLVSAVVTERRVTLGFDERMRAAVLNPTGIKVALNGRRIRVRSARAVQRRIDIVLAEQAFGDDVVTVSFLRDSGGTVPRDAAGNEARAFTRQATNRSLPGCTPTIGPLDDHQLSEASFPLAGRYALALGSVRAIALFVDFPDVAASESIGAVAAHVLDPVPHWYAAASYGRMLLTVDRIERWIRMPRASTDYRITPTGLGIPRDLVRDAVAAADSELDFSPYRLVYVLAPRNSGITYSPAYTNGPGNGVKADGNELGHGAVFGNDTRSSFGPMIAVHETGHALGLPDLYSFAPATGGSEAFVGSWDPMSNHRVGAGFFAWHRWRLRWLDPEQLRCHRGGTRELELEPLDSPGGVKALVIPVDAARAWVLEARRRQGIDAGLCSEGVLAYFIDATILSGSGPIKVRPAAIGADRALALRCGALYDAPYTTAEGRRGFAEAKFEVELVEAMPTGGYRIRITDRS
jgi:M6 family metalloprotease-like protein